MTRKILEEALKAHLRGELLEAKSLYQQAISRGTIDPAAYANLGYILKEEGFLEDAIHLTLKALNLAPNNPLFLANAAGICLEMHDISSAINFSKKAIEIQPDHAIALANLGWALKEAGNPEEALNMTKKSLTLYPSNPTTLITAASIYKELGLLEKALEASKQAFELNPLESKALTLRGKVYQSTGNLEMAKYFFSEALKINKNETEALLSLSISSSPKEATDLLNLAQKIDLSTLKDSDKTYLLYAASNCAHRLNEFETAARHLSTAHKIKLSYAPSEAASYLDDMRFFLGKKYNFTIIQPKKILFKKIFIVGMPRSGSTLLESILSMNPSIKDLGESRAMGKIIKDLTEKPSSKPKSSSPIEANYENLVSSTEYIPEYTVDKQLYNFRFAGLIAEAMPAAKIIHCRRHPLDNILSMLRANLAIGNNYTSSVKDCAVVLIEQEKTMNAYKRAWPNQIQTFNYDQFVCDPKTTLLPLLEWLGLEWQDHYLTPEKNQRPINTASVVQVRRPISAKSLGSWRNYKNMLAPARDLIQKSDLFEDFEL